MGGILGKMSRLSLADDSRQCDLKDKSDTALDNEDIYTPKKNFIADHLLDPRSATSGIKRTPLILTKVENETPLNETPLRAKPYLETDLDVFDANEEVGQECEELVENEEPTSEINQSLTAACECSASLIDEDVFDDDKAVVEDVIAEPILSDDEIINVEGKIVNSPAVIKTKKTLIYEDDSPSLEVTPVKIKSGRTPLGFVSTNTNTSPLPSPLGGKQWRGIREERIRLGLENTPPSAEPFPQTAQSAPGKVGARRARKTPWARTVWAQDESLVI